MTNRGRYMHMSRWKSALLGAALAALPVSANAQTPGTAAQPTAERLASAEQLMAAMMPAEQRDAMVEEMMTAMIANIIPGIRKRIDEKGVLSEPGIKEVFDHFIDRQRDLAIAQLKVEMPKLIEAMARAYARRFTTAQMDEMHAFFRTPTGQAYVKESMGIMSDPDVAAWQRDSITKSMEKLPEELELLRKQLEEKLGRPIGEAKA
ncbi:DUF2059 domain-containing protein [Sphingopyxis sp.]|uniref:DUF2059 domain-containing protein n=1 Tax=Sphingopyxis sp. TaxID=1908224 RepID=UPI0010F6E7C1|nr:DUF2059 domain-containing protein [Sphingopyxis sp.]MBR2171222.1 DUF2059 domain-containing protein [Sphingopyxis sp.]